MFISSVQGEVIQGHALGIEIGEGQGHDQGTGVGQGHGQEVETGRGNQAGGTVEAGKYICLYDCIASGS